MPLFARFFHGLWNSGKKGTVMEDSFDRKVLDRLPLAEAVLLVMQHVFDDQMLTAVFDQHRAARPSEKRKGVPPQRLMFPEFVRLLWDGLTGPRSGIRAELLKAKEEERLPISLIGVYQRLSRVPVELSLSLFREAAARLRELVPMTDETPPQSLSNFDVEVLDGKVIKHVQRKRPELRLDQDNAMRLLGGSVLVARNRWTGLADNLVLHPDGEANDITFVPALLDSMPPTQKRRLYVADRAFGVFEIARQFGLHQAEFLLRKHGQTKFIPDPDRDPVHSKDRFGRPVVQQWGWITRGKQTKRQPAERIAVRQITVTRDSQTLTLFTSLLDADAFPVDVLLDTYLDRWDIEKMFQTTTEVFGLRQLVSSSAEGTLIQFVLCTLIYNVIQLIKRYVAESQDLPEQSISSEMLHQDVSEELISAARMLPAQSVAETSESTATIIERLHALLDDQWHLSWQKSNDRPRDPSRPPKPKPELKRQTKPHDSVHRILKRSLE
jgi:hypothetical protein